MARTKTTTDTTDTTTPAGLYRKKPVDVPARLATKAEDIDTSNGPARANPGDWILTDVLGKEYPCTADIFETTYEPATEDTGAVPVRVIHIHDGNNMALTIDLGARTVSVPAIGDTGPIDLKGEGDVLHIQGDGILISVFGNLELDPPPSMRPLVARLTADDARPSFVDAPAPVTVDGPTVADGEEEE